MKTISRFLILISATALAACNPAPEYNADDWGLTEKRKDSLNFRTNHHYSVNYNFCITADSLRLQIARPYHNLQRNDAAGFATVFKNNRIAVADILIVPEDPADSVWVKVARDQLTGGWIHEKELLQSVKPDAPLSKFLYTFRRHRLIILILCLVVAILPAVFCRIRRIPCPFVYFSDIPSAYPTLLCLSFALTTLLHAAMLRFRPEQWEEFYYNPTLSPFRLPLAASLFAASLWMVLLLALASAEVIYKELNLRDALCYICSLVGVCAASCLLFSPPALFFAAVPCLMLYAFWALRRYFSHNRCRYVCGNCGARLTRAGRCPHCGAWNETT